MNNFIKTLKFDRNGLLPVIIQDQKNNQVLMFAYMNKDALKRTLSSGDVHFYSRSRKKLWLKGESSGHRQIVKNMYIDCDEDVLLIKVEQKKAACHKGFRSCFYREVRRNGNIKVISRKVFNPKVIYG
ncbi:MAG: phosphoribosyl-AMP cyclohydrolase [Candidatus Omnitrophota bacterium]